MTTRIGKYEIKTEIGHGAFGHVYRAHDPTMSRDVAIKVLDSGGDPDIVKLFRNEAGTTGKLHHENILTVYEFGEHEGSLYLVMELLDGEDLESVIFNHRPLSLLDKILIMDKVGRGLQYAHQKGVVHRDIKPANIMLLPNGGVKIMDFGIARLAKDAELTRSTGGNALGTVRYMSPEQFQEGAAVDRLADIFAFGAVYYELLSGVHPFDANDTVAMINRITSEEPAPIRQLDAELPEELERVVLRALSKERAVRYQSLEDLLFDTEPIARELRQQRAAALMGEAQSIRREDPDGALVKIREILELDSVNETARLLRKEITEENHRRDIEKKIVEAIAGGKVQMERRQFGEAAQLFELALGLGKGDDRARALLDEAHAAQERYRKSSRLIAEGRSEAQRGNFEAALRVAALALEADPGNATVEEFRNTVTDQIEAEKRAATERAIESKLTQARVFVEASRLEESARILEDAAAKYPDDPRLGKAILDVRERLAAAWRAELVAAAIAEVRERMSRRDYSGARERLQTALSALPGNPQLEKMSEKLYAAFTEYQRSEEVGAALLEARTLASGSRHEDALAVLNKLEDRAGHDETVLALRTEITTNRNREDQAALQAVLAEVRAYLTVGVPERGLPRLRSVAGRFGNHPEFRKALRSTETAHAAKVQRELIDRVLEEVARLEQREEWRAAGAKLEGTLNVYPADARLARAQEALLGKIAAAGRHKRNS